MSILEKSPQDYVVEGLVEESNALRAKWHELRPKLRVRDAAAELGVSESQLVATGIGNSAVRIDCTPDQLCQAVQKWGVVMALTRNEHAVHEKFGEYSGYANFHGMAQFAGKEIDLRIFFSHWIHFLAVTEEGPQSPRKSLQIFDIDGSAVHKIFLKDASDEAAFDAFVTAHRATDQTPYLAVQPLKPDAPEQRDDSIDLAGFQQAWRELEDTHQFFGMLKKFGVTRTQALRLAPEGFARRVQNDAVRRVITHCAESGLEFMCFVGNLGIIQIHTGPAKALKDFGDWFNILDPEFNLHLRETGIDSSWVVTKPTRDGDVTSLEIFDAQGNNISLFFGKRKPKQPEMKEWREALANHTEAAE